MHPAQPEPPHAIHALPLADIVREVAFRYTEGWQVYSTTLATLDGEHLWGHREAMEHELVVGVRIAARRPYDDGPQLHMRFALKTPVEFHIAVTMLETVGCRFADTGAAGQVAQVTLPTWCLEYLFAFLSAVSRHTINPELNPERRAQAAPIAATVREVLELHTSLARETATYAQEARPHNGRVE